MQKRFLLVLFALFAIAAKPLDESTKKTIKWGNIGLFSAAGAWLTARWNKKHVANVRKALAPFSKVSKPHKFAGFLNSVDNVTICLPLNEQTAANPQTAVSALLKKGNKILTRDKFTHNLQETEKALQEFEFTSDMKKTVEQHEEKGFFGSIAYALSTFIPHDDYRLTRDEQQGMVAVQEHADTWNEFAQRRLQGIKHLKDLSATLKQAEEKQEEQYQERFFDPYILAGRTIDFIHAADPVGNMYLSNSDTGRNE